MPQNNQQKVLRQLINNKQLEPYITHIRFPNYKNLSADTKIDFTYPITALVGANGTNKSSVLRALYGSPGYNNLGNLWFSTSIDPIKETGSGPSCFIYGQWNQAANKVVEVLKTRVHDKEDPDYWEPSRPIKKYGMELMPPLPEDAPLPKGRLKTRWETIDKNVVYFDFRAALSAFDKFFYHNELKNKPNTYKNKKEFIRSRTPHLKRAIEQCLLSYTYRRRERIVEKDNRSLSDEARKVISIILGREYVDIRLVRHTFFNSDAYTCFMRLAGLSYSEAFAGSGEFAVVRLVDSVLNAPVKSLILLDEPEVSLHPGAQDRLIDFLFEQVKLKKHQIVISTHSPTIVRKLPPDAIKVFVLDPATGKIGLPRQDSMPEEAFFYLGEPLPGRVTIIVEDILAKEIVQRALRSQGEALTNLFSIHFFPGGAKTLWGHYLPIFAAEQRSDILVMFDGDERPEKLLPDPATIPQADEAKIKDEIFRVAGVDVQFYVDGGVAGGNAEQLGKIRRDFIAWAKTHTDYLPGSLEPEAFIWENMKHDEFSSSITNTDPKIRFEQLARKQMDIPDYESVDGQDILSVQRTKLATIPVDHPDLVALKDRLLKFAEEAGIV